MPAADLLLEGRVAAELGLAAGGDRGLALELALGPTETAGWIPLPPAVRRPLPGALAGRDPEPRGEGGRGW